MSDQTDEALAREMWNLIRYRRSNAYQIFMDGCLKLLQRVRTESGRFHYPHMCRDEHEEVGFRWNKELCPVCDAVNRGRAEERQRAERIVEVEPEMPGEAPEEMIQAMRDNPVGCLRATVIVTKKSIIRRLREG